MRRIAHQLYGIRFVLATSIVLAFAAILPLVALAGDGDPHGI
jgi:hypothetical protein